MRGGGGRGGEGGGSPLIFRVSRLLTIIFYASGLVPRPLPPVICSLF